MAGIDLREQLCKLPYHELSALAVRLYDLAEHCRNPGAAEDIRHAMRAVSDLATIKFGVEEIAVECGQQKCVTALMTLIGKEQF